jgi:hypothetical protein
MVGRRQQSSPAIESGAPIGFAQRIAAMGKILSLPGRGNDISKPLVVIARGSLKILRQN